MIQFPNCKLNLGLAVTEKRDDGFHNLETVFMPLQLFDALEFVESQELKLEISGIKIPGKIEDNILLKAYHLLKNDFPFIPNIHMHLLKKIPTGGGLGGGSSDASFLLKMLNTFFKLELDDDKLISYALKLGSDCPFFILNTPCFATGRGEQLVPLKLDVSEFSFVLILPGIHISTAQAFANLVPKFPTKSIQEIIQQPLSTWKEELKNDFEIPIFKEYPTLQHIKQILYEAGCEYASMSGSGSTMFGMIHKTQLDTLKSNVRLFSALNQMEICFID